MRQRRLQKQEPRIHPINAFRENWRSLKNGTPGRRFAEFYDARHERRKSESSVMRVLIIAGGLLLVLGGVAIGWLPGPGGFISIFGLALLATEFRRLAQLLDRAERVGQRLREWVATRWRRSSIAVRVVAVLATVSLAAAAAWAAGAVIFG